MREIRRYSLDPLSFDPGSLPSFLRFDVCAAKAPEPKACANFAHQLRDDSAY